MFVPFRMRKYFHNKFITNNFYKYEAIRCHSDAPRKLTFHEINAQRRAEARRSLIVQVSSVSSFKNLYEYCSKVGDIIDIHHYKNLDKKEDFMLIEFSTEEHLKNVVEQCGSNSSISEIDLHSDMLLESPFFWFRLEKEAVKKTFNTSKCLAIENGIACIEDYMLSALLKDCDSVSDQIQCLYDKTKMNDISIRLRYMKARQLEMILGSLYSNIYVQPIGSSIDGLGKIDCNLYMNIKCETPEVISAMRRLVYQEKKFQDSLALESLTLELIAEVLLLRAPGVTDVQVEERCLKYHHSITNLNCAICYNYETGMKMAELFWLYGSLDSRVQPLTFAVHWWGKTSGVAHLLGQEWVANTILTLTVVFFLQQDSSMVLPNFEYLENNASKEDKQTNKDYLDCLRLLGPNKLAATSYNQSKDKLESLLCQFFEFYSRFDFENQAISIIRGVPVTKPNASPFYIEHPLQPNENFSKNDFMLIEFSTEEHLKNVVEQCGSNSSISEIDLHSDMLLESPFFWFRLEKEAVKKTFNTSKCLAIENGIACIEDYMLSALLKDCDSVSDQIQCLYDKTKMNDISIRLRYMKARQLEMILGSLYSNIYVQPICSSIDGLGKIDCNLYMNIKCETPEVISAMRRLVYQEKKFQDSLALESLTLELIAEVLLLRAPGVTDVQVEERCLKYHHSITNLNCAICYNYETGMKMAELFWLYGSLDSRVQPLTFAVHWWGKTSGVAHLLGQEWVANTILTLTVVFFLQQDSSMVLPNFEYLENNASKEDKQTNKDYLDCLRLLGPNKLAATSYNQSKDKLESLLCQFFEFYSRFDFENQAISIIRGVPVTKPNSSPFYIEHPLQPNENFSKNVRYEQLVTFKLELQNAAWSLENMLRGDKSHTWGLLRLFEFEKTRTKRNKQNTRL